MISRAELVRRVRAAQARGERVVMCHGCFDVLHAGHVHHLESAAGLGEMLIVTVTADAHVGKGPNRPVVPAAQRARCLAALAAVDLVAINDAPTAERLIAAVRPDIYAKGPDYALTDDNRFRAERIAAERFGGRVAFTSGDVVLSSTRLIAELNLAPSPAPLDSTPNATPDAAPDEQPIARERLLRRMRMWRGLRIAVVGEVIIDRYMLCERDATASADEVLRMRPMGERSYDGGSAVIARHVAALGARPTLITVLPRDERANEIEARLVRAGVEVRAVRSGSVLPEKLRYACGGRPVAALDVERGLRVEGRDWNRVLRAAADDAAGWDAVIVPDFGLGLFNVPRMRELCALLRPGAGVMAGDVSGARAHLAAMRAMDVLCPNEGELRAAMGGPRDDLEILAATLRDTTGCSNLVVTRGRRGLMAFERSRAWSLPARARRVVDPLGCGDALLAAATLSLAAGGELAEACALGSMAAAVQAGRLGNDAVGIDDVCAAMEPDAPRSADDSASRMFRPRHDHLPAAHAEPA